MILDERKEQAITYLLAGYTISDVARLINASRQTIYNWLEDEEFRAELDKRRQEIVKAGNQKIVKDLDLYINKIKLLATKAKSEKVQLDAAIYLLDRVYGTPRSKVDIDVEKTEETSEKVDKDVLKDILQDDTILPFPNAQ
ncbi:IS630 transposase-related protein [Caldicoprobacter faecalis]|uniref:Transposase n=1 Tax=Caldicoprobacter faecalis TaxID=937334 RepID=A0A1I5WTH1_9FIRM|nr:IS630 transposase-related protein [Caldicoprobacter faecalis]SFQ23053.1 Transposase [Caldicoprobacter faecalis]